MIGWILKILGLFMLVILCFIGYFVATKGHSPIKLVLEEEESGGGEKLRSSIPSFHRERPNPSKQPLFS